MIERVVLLGSGIVEPSVGRHLLGGQLLRPGHLGERRRPTGQSASVDVESDASKELLSRQLGRWRHRETGETAAGRQKRLPPGAQARSPIISARKTHSLITQVSSASIRLPLPPAIRRKRNRFLCLRSRFYLFLSLRAASRALVRFFPIITR